MENFIKNNKIINYLFVKIGSFIFKLISLFIKVDDKKILFSSGMGNFIGDSPIYIYESLIKDTRFKDYELIWAVKDVEKYKQDYNVVKIDTLEYFYHAFSAKIWITSVNIERGLNFKKKRQLYINTWHGIPLKHVGLDVKARHDYNFSQIDIFLTSGQYEEDIYRNAFNLKDRQMVRTGLPRNITLENYKDTSKINILNKLGLEEIVDKKIILFAPTWKDYDYKKLDLNNLMDNISDDYVLLLKSHPLEPINVKGNNIINVNHISDIPSLMKVSDILISDYSSIMIDYAILERPILVYIPDFETYKTTRGLYVDENNLAPNVFENEENLITFIKEIQFDQEKEKTKQYRNQFFDVNADKSIDIIKNKIIEYLEESDVV